MITRLIVEYLLVRTHHTLYDADLWDWVQVFEKFLFKVRSERRLPFWALLQQRLGLVQAWKRFWFLLLDGLRGVDGDLCTNLGPLGAETVLK